MPILHCSSIQMPINCPPKPFSFPGICLLRIGHNFAGGWKSPTPNVGPSQRHSFPPTPFLPHCGSTASSPSDCIHPFGCRCWKGRIGGQSHHPFTEHHKYGSTKHGAIRFWPTMFGMCEDGKVGENGGNFANKNKYSVGNANLVRQANIWPNPLVLSPFSLSAN